MQTTQMRDDLGQLASRIMIVAQDEDIIIHDFKDELTISEDGRVIGVVELKYEIPASLVELTESSDGLIGCSCGGNCGCLNQEEDE